MQAIDNASSQYLTSIHRRVLSVDGVCNPRLISAECFLIDKTMGAGNALFLLTVVYRSKVMQAIHARR